MESSDEEGEIVPDMVTDYHFINKNEEPVSFSVLQLHWKEGEVLQNQFCQYFYVEMQMTGFRKCIRG